MDSDVIDACYFRAKELAKRIVDYLNYKDRENFLRTRFNRYSTPFPGKSAVADVLQDEVLDETTTQFLLKELGRQGSTDLAAAALEWLLQKSTDRAISTKFFNAVINCCAVSFQSTTALRLLEQMQEEQLTPDITSYNMAIAACSHGGHITEAFEVVDRMQAAGLHPNTFTALMLIQCCNFKKQGSYQYSIRAYKMLQEVGVSAPPAAVDALLEVCVVAMSKSVNSQQAEEVFAALAEMDLARDTKIYNALLGAYAKRGEWQAALTLFDRLQNSGVHADTDTYNALIRSCVVAGELNAALEVFEWMVDGQGAAGPVPADVDTFNMLIQACHQAGMLEKALEVMAWLRGTGVEFNATTYDELINTVEIAQLWDDKAASQALATSLAIFPHQLRPAPFDGMRMLYLEHLAAHEEEEALGREKLGTTWVPSNMRGSPRVPSPATTSTAGQNIINNVSANKTLQHSPNPLPPPRAFAPPTPLLFSRMPSMRDSTSPGSKIRLPSPITRELLTPDNMSSRPITEGGSITAGVNPSQSGLEPAALPRGLSFFNGSKRMNAPSSRNSHHSFAQSGSSVLAGSSPMRTPLSVLQ